MSGVVLSVLAVALALSVATLAAEAENRQTALAIGPGHGVQVTSPANNPCGAPYSLQTNYDGGAENGYMLQYSAVQCCTTPDAIGAFAECFTGPACVCGIELNLTSCCTCPGAAQKIDLYIWANDPVNNAPGAVLRIMHDVTLPAVGQWPSISTVDLQIPETWVNSTTFWAGYWINYGFGDPACGSPTLPPCQIYIAADTNGFGGCPMTNSQCGSGGPRWCNVSTIWGPTQSLGIGVWSKPTACTTPLPGCTAVCNWQCSEDCGEFWIGPNNALWSAGANWNPPGPPPSNWFARVENFGGLANTSVFSIPGTTPVCGLSVRGSGAIYQYS